MLTERLGSDGKARYPLYFYLCHSDSCNIFQYRSCWVGRWLTVCWVDLLPLFLIPGEFCHVGCRAGRNKVGRERVSGWQPIFGNTIPMLLWEELSSHVMAQEKLLPPFPRVLSSFLALFWFVLGGQSCPVVLQSTAGISTGRAESVHCDIIKVICAVMLTDLPKLELVFVVESKKKPREMVLQSFAGIPG